MFNSIGKCILGLKLTIWCGWKYIWRIDYKHMWMWEKKLTYVNVREKLTYVNVREKLTYVNLREKVNIYECERKSC